MTKGISFIIVIKSVREEIIIAFCDRHKGGKFNKSRLDWNQSNDKGSDFAVVL